MTRNKYDEGLAPSGPTRLAAAVLLTIGGLLIVIPPNGFWSTLSMTAASVGFFRIARRSQFPNTWWFWLFGGISFLQSSGIVFPITKFEFPTRALPAASYYLGCLGAVTSGLFGLYMFLGYAWTDIRAGRIRFEDD